MMSVSNTDPAVDDYIAKLPDDVRERLGQIRTLVRRVAPDAVEAMGYGVPSFKLKGKPLVYYAGYPKHVGVYPLPDHPSDALADEIAPHVAGKGTLRFLNSKPLPLDLIQRVVESRRDAIEG